MLLPLLPLLLLLLTLISHVAQSQPGKTCFSESERQSFLSRLSPVLEDLGFTIQPGTFSFTDIQNCRETISCSFQNGNSPYGFLDLPRNPFEPVFQEPPIRGNVSVWRFSLEDAALVLFCTPPPSAYFGFTPYVMEKFTQAESWLPLFASLGDTANDRYLKYFGNSLEPTGEKFYVNGIVTVSGDQSVFQEINQALQKAFGVDPALVNNEVAFPFGFNELGLKHGLEETSDLYNLFFRQALAEDSSQWEEYTKVKPFSVVRISRNRKLPIPPHIPAPAPVLRNRELPYDETFLAPALRGLVRIVREEFSKTHTVERSLFSFAPLQFLGIDWGYDCYTRNLLCFGDNRDSQYVATTPPFYWRNDTLAIYVGVNHNATKMAYYSNVVIYDFIKQVGVSSISNKDYQGSADQYLKGTIYEEDAQFLYVVKFRRNCNSEAYCVSVEGQEFPSIADDRLALFMTRAYVSPAGVGPDVDDLVLPVALWGRPL